MTPRQGFIIDPDRYPHLAIESHRQGVVITLRLPELKDEQMLREVEAQVVEFVREHHPERLVLDFKPVRFMSSMMLRVLMRVRDWVLGNDGQLKLAGLAPHLRELFQITKLDGTMFFLYPSVDEALAAF